MPLQYATFSSAFSAVVLCILILDNRGIRVQRSVFIHLAFADQYVFTVCGLLPKKNLVLLMLTQEFAIFVASVN